VLHLQRGENEALFTLIPSSRSVLAGISDNDRALFKKFSLIDFSINLQAEVRKKLTLLCNITTLLSLICPALNFTFNCLQGQLGAESGARMAAEREALTTRQLLSASESAMTQLQQVKVVNTGLSEVNN
jgi:hypothetical protein